MNGISFSRCRFSISNKQWFFYCYGSMLRAVKKGGIIMLCLFCLLVYFNAPSVKQIVTVDRQCYREAVRYVEQELRGAKTASAIIAIGYAGEHFQYYTSAPILIPQTLEQFHELLERNTTVWCLITAWLPSLRPPHEDRMLYAESPEHEKIYDAVLSRFMLKKEFPAKFPTRIYQYTR
ncbi:MAG: hypothetical protein MZU91_05425 [Desulfosudis oleivorans]|nr:hypothetical protein [Desulfosudis oleivorans]